MIRLDCFNLLPLTGLICISIMALSFNRSPFLQFLLHQFQMAGRDILIKYSSDHNTLRLKSFRGHRGLSTNPKTWLKVKADWTLDLVWLLSHLPLFLSTPHAGAQLSWPSFPEHVWHSCCASYSCSFSILCLHMWISYPQPTSLKWLVLGLTYTHLFSTHRSVPSFLKSAVMGVFRQTDKFGLLPVFVYKMLLA